jgi:hypothetical protein
MLALLLLKLLLSVPIVLKATVPATTTVEVKCHITVVRDAAKLTAAPCLPPGRVQ